MNPRLGTGSRPAAFREWLLLCVALVAIGAAIALELFIDRSRIETSERERLLRLDHIVNEVLETRLVAIYKTLTAMRANAMQLKQPHDINAHSHDLQVLGDALQGVRTLLILDGLGRAIASNRQELIGQDFSQRPYFIKAKADNNPATLYLSAPYTTLLGAYAMQATRVVVDGQGRFAGIVAATLDPGYFRTLLESLRYSEDMWAAIAHGSGIQFLMVPDQPGMAGKNLAQPGSFFTRHVESGAAESILSGEVFATGEQRLMALRTVSPESLHMDQKLVVAIGRDESAMFAGWRKDAYEYLVGYLLAIVVSLAGLLFYQRRREVFWRQQEHLDAELAISDQRFRDVVEASADWIWELDARHRYNFVSESVHKLLGYTPDEILGRTPFDLMPPEEAERVSREFGAIESRRESFRDLENINLCKDGTRRHVLTSGRPIFDHAGTLVGYRGLDRDITERKCAEESHRREEALKQAVLDSVPASIVVLGRDGLIVDTNQAWRTFGQGNGAGAVDWQGINYLDAVRRALNDRCEDAAAALNGIAGVLSGALPEFAMEYACHSPETNRWFGMTVTPLGRGEGGVVIAHTDITRRQQDESRMRTLSAAIEQSPNSVIITDPQSRISYVNQAFCALSGYSSAEVIGQYANILGSEGTPPEISRSLREALSAGRDWYGEFHNRRRNGQIGIDACHIAPVHDADGQITHFVSVQEDVTEQRRISKELEIHREHLEHLVNERTGELLATESRLNLLINSTADGILELSPNGIIRMVNTAAAEILGYPPDELIGRNVHDAIHYQHQDGSSYPARECEVMGAIIQGRRLRLESDVLWRSDGNPVPVTVATHPIWRNNRIAGAVMSFFDITERTQADEAREKARVVSEALAETKQVLAQQMQYQLTERAESAERLAKVKSEFLANMSHEIRTPLNGVLGLAQIGYRDSLGRSKTQETFARILSSGKLLLTVINDILDISKIEAGKLSVESVPLDPACLMDEAIHAVSLQAEAKGLTLVPEKAVDLPAACLGDPIRISQILLNLLSNAIKFTAAGTIRIGAHRVGDVLIFSVTDTGVGIDAAQIGRLFMPFEQADSSTTRKFGGTGLGLAISRRLADIMGGSLQATSMIGVGTTFELQLPLKETAPIATESFTRLVSGGTQRLAGIRVLVAEDTEMNRIVLEDMLVGEGATVDMVENGRLAVETVKQRPNDFDVVLADVQMPEMDGVEATLEIRKLVPHLPVIGQTAHALKEEHDRCLKAGMAATITKPIDIEMLVTTVLANVVTPQSQSFGAPLVFDVSPQPATRTAIDWNTLASRYRTRPEFIDRLVYLATQANGMDAEHLRRLIIAADVAEIGKIAHSLKGLAGNIYAPELEKQATRVMHAARAESPETLDQADELANAVEQVMIALQRGRPGSPIRPSS